MVSAESRSQGGYLSISTSQETPRVGNKDEDRRGCRQGRFSRSFPEPSSGPLRTNCLSRTLFRAVCSVTNLNIFLHHGLNRWVLKRTEMSRCNSRVCPRPNGSPPPQAYSQP